jgi:cation diffusion facilitator family transporter
MDKIQEITSKLYSEGVEKGKKEAEMIIAEAKATRDQIVAEAKKEAEQILASARKETEEWKRNTESELKLFASQALEALKSEITNLVTGVWTSAGVIAGVLAVKFTGLLVLDPIIAIVVALNIVYTGYRLIGRSASELMDASIPQEEIRQITDYFDSLKGREIDYHSLLTRQAGYRKFISFHLLVPGRWTVKEGHDFAETIEQEIEKMFDGTVTVTTHIEPIEDPLSLNDINIDRSFYSTLSAERK